MTVLRPLIVFGTRPEAIKLAPVVHAARDHSGLAPIVCATAQHRDMLDPLIEYFGIQVDADLDLMHPGQSLAELTARCLDRIDGVLTREHPDCVVVQGDTTTAMAAALAAFYRRIPVVHVEAGLRTGRVDAPFPEELNRRSITTCATLHCAPTRRTADNLHAAGALERDVRITGNTVLDALAWTLAREQDRGAHWRERYSFLADRPLVLVTAHRRENLGEGMQSIARALGALARAHPQTSFVFPIHKNPQVRAAFDASLDGLANVHRHEPVPYPEFVWLMNRATLILSDSGGVQEEAPSLRTPVLVTRDTTERGEAVEAGAVRLVGLDEETIVSATSELLSDPSARERMEVNESPFGDGQSAGRIVDWMIERFG